MSNFTFLVHEFESLKIHALKSEMYAMDDPDTSAIYSRKALESSVKFIYKMEEELGKKLMNKLFELSKLMEHKTFVDIIPSELMDEMHLVRKLGNKAVHTNHPTSTNNSLYANKCVYKLQRWIVESYSSYDVEGDYDATLLLPTKSDVSAEEALAKSEEEERLAEENAKLQAELEKLRSQVVKPKAKVLKVAGLSEKETRQKLIDVELFEAGYDIDAFKHGVDIEYKLTLEDGSTGYADYVIWAEDGKPLAVIEAKKSAVSVTAGKHQAKRYTDALKKECGCDVLTFVTNGRVIEYSDGHSGYREIHSIFPKHELHRALQKKEARLATKPSTLSVDDAITDRGYQKRVIGSVLKSYEAEQRRALLVMATGTGKTRVSASISDVLIRAGWVRKVLFLADRKELVSQAKNNYNDYLNETCVDLVKEKDLDNRMHFGTYETVHNLIQKGKYNSAYFDLIVVDEAHRTIYKKYRAIFEYFDAFVLGLTATPADEVHRNTYAFFQTSEGEPTDTYDLARAIADGNLVDFKPYEIDLGIVSRGIKYADLSEEEKEEFEDKFDEDEEEISASEINQRVLNKETNEKVLQYLDKHGLKIDDGNKIGKTIIFAKNKKHAEYIKTIWDRLYPSRAEEAQIIHSEISHVESLIDNFKNPHKDPQVAISVDMLDTGIDVPELLNLVFFKPVKSKIKFWQMIGRGTRLSPDLFGERKDKESFNIFDFCANFSYFDIHADGLPSQRTVSLKERLFLKRVSLLGKLEDGSVKDAMRTIVQLQVDALDVSQYQLKKQRHVVEALQKADLNFLTDETVQNLKKIAEYIEDAKDVEVQRFEMLTLNTQEAIVKGKETKAFVKQIKERCYILKSKASNVTAIQKHENEIDDVLAEKIDLESIEELESLKESIAHLANLSLGKRVDAVETTFRDKIEAVRDLKSKEFIDRATVETEIQKVLGEYIEQIAHLKEVQEADLISDRDINDLKHHLFSYEKMVEDRLQNNDAFAALMQEVMQSSKKEIANKIYDNYIEAGNYTQKQIELTNRIKNIVFDKKYVTLEDSLHEVKEDLYSDFHPLATIFERLSEMEQEMIFGLITLLSSVSEALDREQKDIYAVNNVHDDLGMVAEPESEYGREKK